MRKIKASQIAVFASLLSLIVVLAIGTTALAFASLDLGDFRGLALFLAAIVLLYVYALIVYRLFLTFFPLRPGEVAADSQQEFVYHVYLLFYLILFYPIMRSGSMPIPLLRVFYLALGARLGDNTYSSGLILDPGFVTIGSNCIVGQGALIVPHIIEGARLGHYPIVIGNNATIGAGATVLSGVKIGNDAIVSTGAVVTKNTVIGDGEIWGGIPARLIGHVQKTLPPPAPA